MLTQRRKSIGKSLLTIREAQCLEWLGRGLDNDSIGQQLQISVPTVSLHLANARRKLGALSREHALVLAMKQGLIEP